MTHDPFGDLRALLNSPASPDSWARVCALIEAFEASDYVERVSPYIAQHVQQWEDTLRVMPAAWVRALLRGQWRRGMEQCKRLALKDVDLSPSIFDVLAHDPSRAHAASITILNLSGSRIREHEFTGLYDSPALRHMRHIHLGLTVVESGGPSDSFTAYRRSMLPDAWRLQSISGAFMTPQAGQCISVARRAARRASAGPVLCGRLSGTQALASRAYAQPEVPAPGVSSTPDDARVAQVAQGGLVHRRCGGPGGDEPG